MNQILATSEFCGPCRIIKDYIKKNNLDVEIKTMENDMEFFREKTIMTVPRLLVEENIYIGVDQIINFFESQS